jgi:dihydropteroate synthase
LLSPRRSYRLRLPDGRDLRFGVRTLIMGVLNVTPDSFSDGGRFAEAGAAVEQGLRMAGAGADIIDVGGESTRPGARPVSADVERARVVPVIDALVRRTTVPISVDTTKVEVARAALDAGAVILNDVSALRQEPGLARLAASARAPLILMHSRGPSSQMYERAQYRSIAAEVADELGASMACALEAGVERDALVLDPGLGFGKVAAQSAALLAHLDAPPLLALDRPWLVGPSRKSFLTAAVGDVPASDRDWASAAAVAAAVLVGAHAVRVHLVAEMVQVVRVADLLRAHAEVDRTAASGS